MPCGKFKLLYYLTMKIIPHHHFSLIRVGFGKKTKGKRRTNPRWKEIQEKSVDFQENQVEKGELS
ncbi:Uncharacterized protein TCM_014058 [Theobroma cacao]|uniref:Uncharacterized protein n=1 Tax=Theobroma cacao TaxID=3641 RepID=A0A061FX94_THECC|nr:Uncharacterized protein TCM_014058 [Theobroma cacao]